MVDLVAARVALAEFLRPRSFGPIDSLADKTDVYNELGINGWDLGEVFDWIVSTYDVDCSAVTPRDYDINEPPGRWWSNKPYKAVTVGDILAAIERGRWIVPE